MDRFWSKAEIKGIDDCWIWKRGLSIGGYPRYRKGHFYYAHVYAYTLIKGAIPDGLELDHTCRNRSCINPWHLEAVTHQTNMLRGNTFVSIQAKQTSCKNGHSLELSYKHNNRRLCRFCRAQASKRHRERVKSGQQTGLG